MKLDPHLTGSQEIVYENQYQKVHRIRVDFADYTKEYFVTETGEHAGIAVVHAGSVLLVRQYRLLINTMSWELPGGKVDDGETPQAAAVRECPEETGVRCLNPRPLLFYHAGLDTVYNPTHIFYSEEVEEGRDLRSIHPREVTGCEWIPLDRCFEMIVAGEILDCFSIVGLLAYRQALGLHRERP